MGPGSEQQLVLTLPASKVRAVSSWYLTLPASRVRAVSSWYLTLPASKVRAVSSWSWPYQLPRWGQWAAGTWPYQLPRWGQWAAGTWPYQLPRWGQWAAGTWLYQLPGWGQSPLSLPIRIRYAWLTNSYEVTGLWSDANGNYDICRDRVWEASLFCMDVPRPLPHRFTGLLYLHFALKAALLICTFTHTTTGYPFTTTYSSTKTIHPGSRLSPHAARQSQLYPPWENTWNQNIEVSHLNTVRSSHQ